MSNETLLSLLPFITDPKAETEKLKAEQPAVNYFPNTESDTDEQ